MLSDEQFEGYASAVNEPGGGFTAAHIRTGAEVGDAFMVGGVAPVETEAAPITGPRLRAFVGAHEDVLSHSRHHLGGWHGGRVPDRPIDLDVSERFGLHEEGHARMAAIKRGEAAVGRLEGGEYTQLDNPLYPGQMRKHKNLASLKRQLESWD